VLGDFDTFLDHFLLGDAPMKSCLCVRCGIAIAAAVLLIAGSSYAAPITVVNPSFESTGLPNDGDISTTIEGWTYFSSEGGSGIAANPTGYAEDPAYGFIDATGTGTPLGGDGVNVAWEYELGGQYGLFQQVLDTTLQAGCTYTFTVAVGMVPTDGNLGFQLILSTEAAPGSLTTLLTYNDLAPGAMTPGQFIDQSLTFTPTPDQIALYGGQRLMLGLCGYSTGGIGRIAYDNVRASVVPEPGTIALLASGLIGLVACGWRKRK
jgi:hypothetical protein